MKGLHASGIFEWWQRFVSGGSQTDNLQPNTQLKKPSMSGNILVIFYTLFFGLIAACVSFIAEFTCIIFVKKTISTI